ncbi:MAG: hemerythrin domain-containing protein [Gammaproteobacteria bacterium]|nr:hemerythrin domain-containing protein [Gammaproteobacteria bacterium]
MQKLMAELRRDHRNIGRLLKLLEGELDKMSNDGDPDLLLMLDIVDYVENYPDLVHHPRENLVFAAYKAKSLEGAEIVDGLLEEHRLLPKMTRLFRTLLEEVSDSAIIITRDELRAKAQEYIDRQREHLNTEERLMFPMIESTLDEEDWHDLEATSPEYKDPLFDAEVDRYQNILNYLREREQQEEPA